MRHAASWTTLATLLALLASPADARRVHIAASGGNNNSTTATSIGTQAWNGTPYATWSKVACSVAAYDTVVAAAGTYADGIINRQYCGMVNVTIAGDSANPDRVVVPSVTISCPNNQYMVPNLSIIGIRVNGSVSLSEPISPPSPRGDADGFLMRKCVVRDELTITDVDFRLDQVRIGFQSGQGADSSSRFRIIPKDESVVCTMNDVRAWTGPRIPSTWGNGDKALDWWSDNVGELKTTAARCTLRTYAGDGWVTEKATGWRRTANSSFTDCIFELVDSTGSNTTLDQGLLFRDGFHDNLFFRSQFIVRTVRPGVGAAHLKGTSRGNAIQGGRNTWRYCNFKSNIAIPDGAAGRGSVGFDWQMQPGDSFYRNVVACSSGADYAGFNVNNVVGQVYIGNNTFMNWGGGGAVMINDDAQVCSGEPCCWTGRLVFENNIVYSPRTATVGNEYAMGIVVPHASSSFYDADYNLYYHGGSATGARSLYAKTCTGAQALYKPGTGSGSAFEAFGWDAHSVHGSPRLADSTLLGFNASLLSNSAAVSAGRNGVTIGAIEFDVTRPYYIDGLTVAASAQNAVVLSWLATGNDSLTGTAVSYDIRYSTSLLSEATWAAATQVTDEPTPTTAGTVQSKLITGLLPNQLYYFAIKASDYVNESIISNVVSVTTPEGGPEFADP